MGGAEKLTDADDGWNESDREKVGHLFNMLKGIFVHDATHNADSWRTLTITGTVVRMGRLPICRLEKRGPHKKSLCVMEQLTTVHLFLLVHYSLKLIITIRASAWPFPTYKEGSLACQSKSPVVIHLIWVSFPVPFQFRTIYDHEYVHCQSGRTIRGRATICTGCARSQSARALWLIAGIQLFHGDPGATRVWIPQPAGNHSVIKCLFRAVVSFVL